MRVGEQVFVVEKLRQQAFAGHLDEEVIIGWDAADSILVRTNDARDADGAAERGFGLPAGVRAALPVARSSC